MRTVRVDLGEHRSGGSRVFAGRDRGSNVRNQNKLDKLDKEGKVVEVFVPEDVFSINSSFFLGMFGPSIRQLGEEEFRRRYRFVGKDITRVKEAGIREALRTESPL